MSHITLIRHGQANSTAQSEADYDRLSPLGHQQAKWLGTHLKDTKQPHYRLYTGTLRRHIETAEGMDTGLTPIRDARLNELEYFTLASALEKEHGVKMPGSQPDYVHHLPRVFSAWQADEIQGAPETYRAFEERVSSVIKDIAEGEGPALVITSGGFISMAMRQLLGLDMPGMINFSLAVMNTSIHRLYPIAGKWAPVMFNAVPHLEAPERHYAQTHV